MAALILFGGGGDLAMRMLLPSLYFLEHDGLLPDDLKIIGAARSEESADDYIAKPVDTEELLTTLAPWVQPSAGPVPS